MNHIMPNRLSAIGYMKLMGHSLVVACSPWPAAVVGRALERPRSDLEQDREKDGKDKGKA